MRGALMAWTVVFALGGSLLLTLTLTPVRASLFLKKTGREHPFGVRERSSRFPGSE